MFNDCCLSSVDWLRLSIIIVVILYELFIYVCTFCYVYSAVPPDQAQPSMGCGQMGSTLMGPLEISNDV